VNAVAWVKVVDYEVTSAPQYWDSALSQVSEIQVNVVVTVASPWQEMVRERARQEVLMVVDLMVSDVWHQEDLM
jgi:predicted secreted Zn-dependent protease